MLLLLLLLLLLLQGHDQGRLSQHVAGFASTATASSRCK
jgi:hypothetical protein